MVVADELLTDDEGLGQPVGTGLDGVGQGPNWVPFPRSRM